MTQFDRPLRLLPRVRHYDWGTLDFIPRLCGREPTDRPEAELWFGAHADAPASIVLEEAPGRRRPPTSHDRGSLRLDRFIADHRNEVLGPGATDDELPFLTKILSASRPLSIQAHPNRDQARRGFAAETGGASRIVERPSPSGTNRRGFVDESGSSDADANSPAARTYRDANHKPELLYALTPFSALSGFRPAAEAARLLAALRLEPLQSSVRRLESEGAAAFRPLLETLRRQDGADFAAAAEAAARHAAIEATADRRSGRNRQAHDPPPESTGAAEGFTHGDRDAMHWVVRIARHYPDDPLVVAPLFLRLVHLEPGQALFTGSGVPHSYLKGDAVEVMASSDNVLRLGLTSKRVDASELLDILVYEAGDGAQLAPQVDEQPWGTRTRFQPPVDDFRLDVLHIRGMDEAPLQPEGRARIALVLEGEVELRGAAGTETLRPGQAALLPAAASAITATGPGTLALTSPNNGVA